MFKTSLKLILAGAVALPAFLAPNLALAGGLHAPAPIGSGFIGVTMDRHSQLLGQIHRSLRCTTACSSARLIQTRHNALIIIINEIRSFTPCTTGAHVQC